MKITSLAQVLALVASTSALPAELENRAWPSLSNWPSFPWWQNPQPTTTTTRAAATPAPTPSTTSAYVSTTQAVTTSRTTTTSAASPGSTGSGGPAPGTYGGDTENGIVNGQCSELTVIFARGTGESGNVGYLGPQVFKILRSTLGLDKVTVQGVNYPASQQGNMNAGSDGGPIMASLVKQALSQCPGTKISLSGYSQGGMQVHNAVARQGVSGDAITSLVLFGDPSVNIGNGNIPASRILSFCADGDHVCDGSGSFAITPAHMTYGNNAQQAADFIIKSAGL